MVSETRSHFFLALAYPCSLSRYCLILLWILCSYHQDCPPPCPPLHPQCLKCTIVDTAWIRILFLVNRKTNTHLRQLFFLVSISNFSAIGTLITTWLTIHLFSARACKTVVIWLVVLISHCRLELSW